MQVNQWQESNESISWFDKFDKKKTGIYQIWYNFYSSITKEALYYAKDFVDITSE